MCCLNQTSIVATIHHFSSAITITTLLCYVITVNITTSIFSGYYTVFTTRRFSLPILNVRMDHTRFLLPLLFHFLLKQCSNHPKLFHISTLLTLLSLPTGKSLRPKSVRKRFKLELNFLNYSRLHLLYFAVFLC